MTDATAVFTLPKRLCQDNIPEVFGQFSQWTTRHGRAGALLNLDASGLNELDAAGAAMLSWATRRAAEGGFKWQLIGASPSVEAKLRGVASCNQGPSAVTTAPTVVERAGDWGASALQHGLGWSQLAADSLWFSVEAALGRRRLRTGALAWEMSHIGSQALGVVGLIAFLVGATMALQSAAQLRRFGADIFVVDLVAVSLLRELGPLMAAIVVAGRSGAAIAAELGTMKVTEEIDALEAMGIDPLRFLVVPKVLAITVVQPLLTVFSNSLGILGGAMVSAVYLGITPDAFIARMMEVVTSHDILTGLIKSVLFAWLIVLVGAHCGLTTRGGADAVGRSTTVSVVAGIFAVVVMDALASLVFYFGG